jgi:hypothetical protein
MPRQVGITFIADTFNTFFDAAFIYERLVSDFSEFPMGAGAFGLSTHRLLRPP